MFKTFNLTVSISLPDWNAKWFAIVQLSFCIKEEIRVLWAAVQHVHSELNVWGGLDERQPVRTEPDQSPAQQEPHYTTFGFVLSTHASAGIWNGFCTAALKLPPNLFFALIIPSSLLVAYQWIRNEQGKSNNTTNNENIKLKIIIKSVNVETVMAESSFCLFLFSNLPLDTDTSNSLLAGTWLITCLFPAACESHSVS